MEPNVRGRLIPVWRGLYFDLKTWDGSDVFMSADTDHVIATARVVEALDHNKLTGYSAESIDDVNGPLTDDQLAAAGLVD